MTIVPMKILVVDDSLSERMFLMARLDRLGHEVVGAADGLEALSLFRIHSPDLVLLDVVMPVMDGLETARRIRAMNTDWVPIIFLSQMTGDHDIAAGIDAGGDDYLTKPVAEIVLTAKMRAMERIAAMRARQIELTRSLARSNEKLQRLAELDGLTGLPNRRRLEEDLAREWEACARFRQPLGLILIDVGALKTINEQQGPLAGDDCLKQVAAMLESLVKTPPDLLARYGSGKFCVILPDSPEHDVLDFAQHLRAHLAALDAPGTPWPGKTIPPMIEIASVTRIPQAESSSTIFLNEARERLRLAKQTRMGMRAP